MRFKTWLEENADLLDWRPYRYRWPMLGRALLIVSGLAVSFTLAAAVFLLAASYGTPEFHFARLAVPIGSAALIWVHISLVRFARGHYARKELAAMAEDARLPVVYLRPFITDTEGFSEGAESSDPTRFVSWSVEDRVISRVRRFGPVFALGRPGKGPQVGAGRLYAQNDDWEELIARLVAVAQAIIVRVGSSPGIRWEIEQVLRPERRRKAALLLVDGSGYPLSRAEYSEFRKRVLEWTGVDLPERGWNSWYVYFDVEGEARTVGATGIADLKAELASGTDRLVRRLPSLAGWGSMRPSWRLDPYQATDFKVLRVLPVVLVGVLWLLL